MKKILLFTITAFVLLSALTGCSDSSNVSENKDGVITEASDMVEDLTDMIMPDTTAEQRTEATTERNSSSVGGESESTEATSENNQDNARSGRTLPR